MTGEPGVLLPFQRRWLEDRARVKVFEKSRRIGATWCSAAHAILVAGSGRADVWYVSYNEDSAKEFVRDAARWAKHLGVAAKEAGEVLLYADDDVERLLGVRAFQITFPSGKRITALTSSPRNLRGKQGLVIIDEAAFHDDLPGVLKAAFALLMWGGEVWILSTHNGADNAFNTLCEEIRDGKRDASLHRVTIEDALEEGLYERICDVLGEPYSVERERAWLQELTREYGEGAREELYCEPARGGASYIGRPLIEAAMEPGPVVRLSRDERWQMLPQEARTRELVDWADAVLAPLCATLPQKPHAFGWDFGRYSDRSVLAPVTLEQDLTRRVPFLLELEGMPHNDQWTLLSYVVQRLPCFFAGMLDATGNGSWIAEQALITWGEQVIEPVALSVKWYAEHMPLFKEGHERALVRYPRDLDVRNDLLLIRRIDGVPRLPADKVASKTSKNKRHGDAAIALVLAYAAACKADREAERWNALSADQLGGGWGAYAAE